MGFIKLVRWRGNPLLRPRPGCFWEAGGTFNPAVFSYGGRVYLLYRQVSRSGISTLGLAVLDGGYEVLERECEPVYVPRESFEVHPDLTPYVNLEEVQLVSTRLSNLSGGSHFGVEDPRTTVLDGKLYLTYVAYNGVDPPRGAISWIDLRDFLEHRWDSWSRPLVITRPGVADKSVVMLPRRVGGKLAFFHRVFPHIWLDYVESFEEFSRGRYLWGKPAIKTRPSSWDSRKVGAGVVVEWGDGLLMIYYGVTGWDDYYYSEGLTPEMFRYPDSPYYYKVGIAVLNRENPEEVLYRPDYPIGAPTYWYEMYPGGKPGVMYPTGAALVGEKLLVYYGASDYFVALGEVNLRELKEELEALPAKT